MDESRVGQEIQKLWSDFVSAYSSRDDGSYDLHLHDYAGKSIFKAFHNEDRQLYCASAFKPFVLIECLRQYERGENGVRLDEILHITDNNKSVAAPEDRNAYANRPSGTGVTLADALNAMIEWSDNTATDMVLHRIGADRVQKFVDSNGLKDVIIPVSTRRHFLQVYGIEPDQEDPGWQWIQDSVGNLPVKRSPFEVSVRLAAPASAFVSFYHGLYTHLKNTDALSKCREILRGSNAAETLKARLGKRVPVVEMKGGRLNFQGYHAGSAAGTLHVSGKNIQHDRLHFAVIFNAEGDIDNDRMFKDFIDVTCEMLKKVVDVERN